MGDMLLGAGMGLLSQGPSLTPQSSWAGMGAGLMMGRQMTEARRQREMDEARMALERQKFEAAQAAAGAPKYMNVPGVGLVQTNAQGGPEVAIAPPPEVPEQWGAPTPMRVGDRTVLTQEGPGGKLRAIGGGGVTVNLDTGGQVADRVPTPDEAADLGIPEGERNRYLVTKEGAVKAKPQPELTSAEQLDEAKSDLNRLLTEYESMASPTGLWGKDDDKAQATRRQIAERIARIRQPTGILTDADIARAEADVPDVGGIRDARNAPELIANLRNLLGIKLPGASVTGIGVRKYNPATGALE